MYKTTNTVEDSILYPIHKQVETATSLEEGKRIILEVLNQQEQTKDIKQMKVVVQYQIFKQEKLVSWLWNNMLKFGGLGVVCKK